MEVDILHGNSDAGELLKIFARLITEWASDAAPPSKADEASDNDNVVTVEASEASEVKKAGKSKASAKTTTSEAKKPGKANQASANVCRSRDVGLLCSRWWRCLGLPSIR